jgi:hypothetical protein
MSSTSNSPSHRISQLSHRPDYVLDGVINIEPANPSAIVRDSTKSTIGVLDILPLEILQCILNTLNFVSLSHLSRVSLLGNEVVRSLPAYKQLMEHAPHALAALGRTSLLKLHSANTIYGIFLEETCVSCGNYGSFLFLITCERCCYECLWLNPSLWVTFISDATNFFDLTLSQTKSLPIMRSIPGTYNIEHRRSRRRPLELTSVKAAKELTIKVHGSAKVITKKLQAKMMAPGIPVAEYRRLRYLRRALVQQHAQELFKPRYKPTDPRDQFCGMASVHFPSLTQKDTVEKGLWCCGCERTCERQLTLPFEVLSSLVPPTSCVTTVLGAAKRRAWSRSGFLEHIEDCYGVQELDSGRDEWRA